MQSPVWLSWKVDDDGSSLLSGLVVKVPHELIDTLYEYSSGCKKAVIMVISTDVDTIINVSYEYSDED